MMPRQVIAPDNPRAVVVLIHGMGGHKQRYYPFMTYLSNAGYATIIADTRGHGPSTPKEDLGWFGPDGKEAVIQDAIELLEDAHKSYPGLKVFLWGHSMGSLTSRCILKRRPDLIDGLILCGSPSYRRGIPAGILLTRITALFKGERYRSRFVTYLMFRSGIRRFGHEPERNAWLSANMDNVRDFNQDPLCGFRFTLNGYRTVMQLSAETYSTRGWAPSRPEIPVYFVSGADDPFLGSTAAFNKALNLIRLKGYPKTSGRLFPGLRHDIINETDREKVWADMKYKLDSWL